MSVLEAFAAMKVEHIRLMGALLAPMILATFVITRTMEWRALRLRR